MLSVGGDEVRIEAVTHWHIDRQTPMEFRVKPVRDDGPAFTCALGYLRATGGINEIFEAAKPFNPYLEKPNDATPTKDDTA